MNKEKLKGIQRKLIAGCYIFSTLGARDFAIDLVDTLLEEPRPTATEIIMDKRTKLKKLILEMLEIV